MAPKTARGAARADRDATIIVALRARIAELERESMTDALTGAWNRRYLDRMLKTETARSQRQRQPLSVVLCDIDHFKQVNDTHGHPAGDAVLQDFVRALASCLRESDILCRWGGEEFLLCAPGTSRAGALPLAEKLRASVAGHGFSTGKPVTASFGVAELRLGEDTASLLERVDRALYEAKAGGRNCVAVAPGESSDAFEPAGRRSLIELAWRDDYLSGEATIDAQHQELFRLADALIDRSLRQRNRPAELMPAFDVLLGHIERHFGDEERVLAEHGYAELAPHRQIHQSLLKRAAGLRAAAAAGEMIVGTLIEFVAFDIVATHLLSCDRHFFPLFRTPRGTRGVKAAVSAAAAA